ncbi:MAG: hypothetical protein ACFB0C_15015 [Leptolyngbyaceae cyanobacterium]
MGSQPPAFQVPAAPSIDTLRIILVGSPQAVQNCIVTHQQWGYAEAIFWSPPLPTPHPGQIMRILTKRLHCSSPEANPLSGADTH